MIRGTVNARLEAMIRLTVESAGGPGEEIEAVVDTGFNGSLTLPPTVIARLGLAWRSRGSAILANGNLDHFDVYAAIVIWDGAARHILSKPPRRIPSSACD
jgi:predicted aspartyl protease